MTPVSQWKRETVFERDDYTCQYCGHRPRFLSIPDRKGGGMKATLHVDHIAPRSRGGTNDYRNLVTACADCNLHKSDKIIDEVPFAHCTRCNARTRKPEEFALYTDGPRNLCLACSGLPVCAVYRHDMWDIWEETGAYSDLLNERRYYDQIISEGWDVAA